MEVLMSAIKKEKNPVSFEEYVYTTLTTFAIEKSLKECRSVRVNEYMSG
ncbi:hypothetical protein NLC36_03045 [Candidatus Aminicenantes bacterium AC-335-L06]|nr:hypothetical protein [Candidatus Aminicenantes bacterium AC-335-L06]